MKTCFLDGPSLAERLRPLAERCDDLDVAMAYVKEPGLESLFCGVNPLIKRGGRLRIVFGLAERLGITDRKAAECLLKLSNEHANVDVKKLNNGGFHPKLLIFHGSPSFLIVGSANLTGAAQSTNAEANLLVEDPSDELMDDANNFFDRYFASAPRLTRTTRAGLQVHARDTGVPAGPKGSREDCLPLPPQPEILPACCASLDDCPRQWCQGVACVAREIREGGEGFVAMGWNEVGSLDGFATKNDLRRKVAETAEQVWNKSWPRKTKVKYATDQLWDFRNETREGDQFIVYSKCRVLGIAEITGALEYQYRPGSDSSYHQITVRYTRHWKWPGRADEEVIATLGKQGTLMKVEKPNFLEYLISTLP